MSLDAQKLVMLIKQAAVEAVNAKDPMSLKIGEVVSVSPLKISINQKITIPASQLLLTNAVRDYTVYETVDHTTGTALGSISLTRILRHNLRKRKLLRQHGKRRRGEHRTQPQLQGAQKVYRAPGA